MLVKPRASYGCLSCGFRTAFSSVIQIHSYFCSSRSFYSAAPPSKQVGCHSGESSSNLHAGNWRLDLGREPSPPPKARPDPSSVPILSRKQNVESSKPWKVYHSKTKNKKTCYLTTIACYIKGYLVSLWTHSKCDQCGKHFQRSSTLNTHQLMHSGVRRFACHLCSKRFYQNSDLKKHIFVHTGRQNVTCDHPLHHLHNII